MSGPWCLVLAVRSLLSGPWSFSWSLFLLPCTCCTVLVSPSSTQVGEISSIYPDYAIIIAIGLWNPMLNLNQPQILYCGIFIDLLDDVVTGYWWAGSKYLEYISSIRIVSDQEKPESQCRLSEAQSWPGVMGIWNRKGMGRGWERGGQFTSNLGPRWTGSHHAKGGFPSK